MYRRRRFRAVCKQPHGQITLRQTCLEQVVVHFAEKYAWKRLGVAQRQFGPFGAVVNAEIWIGAVRFSKADAGHHVPHGECAVWVEKRLFGIRVGHGRRSIGQIFPFATEEAVIAVVHQSPAFGKFTGHFQPQSRRYIFVRPWRVRRLFHQFQVVLFLQQRIQQVGQFADLFVRRRIALQ